MWNVDKTELMAAVFDHFGKVMPYRAGWAAVNCISPDHSDSHASASVNANKGRYNCHACGLSGDGFDVMLETEGMKASKVLVTLGVAEGSKKEEENEWLF